MADRGQSVLRLVEQPECAEQVAPPVGQLDGERRGSRRHPTPGRIVRFDAPGDRGLGAVRNLSDSGALIETALACALGTPVRIAFDCTNAVQGRIVWRDGNRAGIRFLVPISSSAFIRKVASDRWSETARPPRLSVQASAEVRSGSTSFVTIVGNVSQRGVGVSHSGQLSAGMPVEVAMTAGIRLRGTVRWADGTSAGVELSGGLSAEQLADTRRF